MANSGMRRGRVSRAAPLIGMAGRTAGEAVVASLRRTDSTDFHERQAKRYADQLGHSRGVLMKAGQILSFTSLRGSVGADNSGIYQRALARLQDSAPPMPADVAARVVEQELGAPPETIFAEWDPDPVAAASIGQVHSARLTDGTHVAVKVQYPGVDEAIRADLANTELLATFLQLATSMVPNFLSVEPKQLAAELSVRIGEEIDYRIEAKNQQTFADAYREHPDIRVPQIHHDLSTGRVLTMDFVDGLRFTDAVDAPQELRDQWGQAIYRFGINSIYQLGLFNADPHPGNYLFHEDGTVTFLDFGSVKHFTPDEVDALRAMRRAVAARDPEQGVAAIAGMGVTTSGEFSAAEVMDWFLIGFESLTSPQPFTYTPEYAADIVRRKYAFTGPDSTVLRSMTVDPAYIMLTRIDLGVISVLGALGASADWPAFEKSWNSTGEWT